MTPRLYRHAIFALFFVLAPFAFAQQATFDAAQWTGLKYRMVGPERGGRVTTVTGVPSQPYTFYMGSTGGGVWR